MQEEQTRITCYTSLTQRAAECLGLPMNTTPDDVLRAVIRGQRANDKEMAKKILIAALDAYGDDHA